MVQNALDRSDCRIFKSNISLEYDTYSLKLKLIEKYWGRYGHK